MLKDQIDDKQISLWEIKELIVLYNRIIEKLEEYYCKTLTNYSKIAIRKLEVSSKDGNIYYYPQFKLNKVKSSLDNLPPAKADELKDIEKILKDSLNLTTEIINKNKIIVLSKNWVMYKNLLRNEKMTMFSDGTCYLKKETAPQNKDIKNKRIVEETFKRIKITLDSCPSWIVDLYNLEKYTKEVFDDASKKPKKRRRTTRV